jgi:dephospho-CoA kinase
MLSTAKRYQPSMPDITVFGLTGGIACGKSFVASILMKNLIPVVDADKVAREVVVPGSPGLDQLVQAFGEDILLDDALDRAKLGDMIFGKPEQLFKLNTIMQPLIASRASYLLRLHLQAGCTIVCYDAALIVELGLADAFRPLVAVSCKPETQLERLLKRGLTEDQALARIASQLSNDKRVEAADTVIDTNGTKQLTVEQVEALIVGLTE